MELSETIKNAKKSRSGNFRMVPTVLVICLMVMFVGATIYVLIASLLG